MQSALQQEEITIDKNGVHIVMRGDQQIIEISVDGIIENRIAEAIPLLLFRFTNINENHKEIHRYCRSYA